jgi:hypothetical protein
VFNCSGKNFKAEPGFFLHPLRSALEVPYDEGSKAMGISWEFLCHLVSMGSAIGYDLGVRQSGSTENSHKDY